jgi:Ser/Thr protein kinase RdoA (MazF antagonist)
VQGSLGEKIGEGAFADVHAWAPGQVVKLFKAGAPRRTSWWEARMTRAAFAAGAPAPEVLGEVVLDRRYGIVLQRLEGPTLSQLSRSGAITREQTGAILAALYMSLHNTPAPADVLSLYDWMEGTLRLSGDTVPKRIATGVLTLIERLPPGGELCHVDLHPSNVIMTADGPRIVDWSSMVRAGAALDLACCHILLSELVAETADDPERPRAIDAAVQSEYARLAGLSLAALTAARASYLPIVRVFALLGGAWPAQRERLIQRLEADLRAEDLRR